MKYPAHFPRSILQRVLQTRTLSLAIDWSAMPATPARSQKGAIRLNAMRAKILPAFEAAARVWLFDLPRPISILNMGIAASEADVTLAFAPLTETLEYSRAATTSVAGGSALRARITVDTAVIPWGAAPVTGFWASLFGYAAVSLQSLLAHEFGHVWGIGHAPAPGATRGQILEAQQSIMYEPPHIGTPAATLHQQQITALGETDRAAWAEWLHRA